MLFITDMYYRLVKTIFLVSCIGCFAPVSQTFGQEPENASKKINFRYSQNPKTKPKSKAAENQSNQPTVDSVTGEYPSAEVADNTTKGETVGEFKSRSAAKKTLEVTRKANTAALKPTEIYKVGAGDVLFINLQNAPVKSSPYFTVLNDGTIDYPLVGQLISVGGLTTDEIEDLLREKIKLYENPEVSVKVRDYASHKFTVLGLVENAGEKYLRREAVPLFIIRAESLVQAKANRVTIKRADNTTETIEKNDPKYENVLVSAGDIVEFGFSDNNATAVRKPQFYYIGGNVYSLGQKQFYQGITLTQAILASGGLKNPTAKKIIIRRTNDNGLLTPTEYNLKAINEGKAPDPLLQVGDTIEVDF